MNILISRRIFTAAVIGLAVLLSTTSGPRAASCGDPALTFIQSLGDQAVESLRNTIGSGFEEREAAFRKVMVTG